MTFSATGTGGAGVEPDFAIGTVRLGLGCQGDGEPGDDEFCTEVENETPEPASFLLLTPALLGLVAFTRRRRS
jgi:MYXO-CTERM domain-containing protein